VPGSQAPPQQQENSLPSALSADVEQQVPESRASRLNSNLIPRPAMDRINKAADIKITVNSITIV